MDFHTVCCSSASTCNANLHVNTSVGIHLAHAHCIFKLQMQGVRAVPAKTAYFSLALYVKPLEPSSVSFAIRKYQRAQGQTKRNRREPIIY